jgi:hypothetical protein
MIASAATNSYSSPPAIVIPVSETQRGQTKPLEHVPEQCVPSAVTLEYGKFAPHFSKLRNLLADPSLWAGDYEAPSEGSVEWARRFLVKFALYNIPPTRVVASAEGGTAICFVDGNKYADIESLNSGVILGALSDKHSRPIVWEIEQTALGMESAIDRIREFIYAS